MENKKTGIQRNTIVISMNRLAGSRLTQKRSKSKTVSSNSVLDTILRDAGIETAVQSPASTSASTAEPQSRAASKVALSNVAAVAHHTAASEALRNMLRGLRLDATDTMLTDAGVYGAPTVTATTNDTSAPAATDAQLKSDVRNRRDKKKTARQRLREKQKHTNVDRDSGGMYATTHEQLIVEAPIVANIDALAVPVLSSSELEKMRRSNTASLADFEANMRSMAQRGAAKARTGSSKTTRPAASMITPLVQQKTQSPKSDMRNVLGVAAGFVSSVAKNAIVGTVLQIGVTTTLLALAPSVGAGVGAQAVQVAATVIGSLAVTVVQQADTIITDPKTGLRHVAKNIVGTCVGTMMPFGGATTMGGKFVGRIAGQIVSEKLTATLFGLLESPVQPVVTERNRVASLTNDARRRLSGDRQRRTDALLADKTSETTQTAEAKARALKTTLLWWNKMRAPILIASGVSVLAGTMVFGAPAMLAALAAAPAKMGSTFVYNYVSAFAKRPLAVGSETVRALIGHPYLGPALKQSVLNKLPLGQLEEAAVYVTKRILEKLPVKEFDENTRALLKNHVRESLIKELMVEDLLERVARIAARQATLIAAEKSVEAVQTNWTSVEDAMADLRAGSAAVAKSIKKQLDSLTGNAKPMTEEQLDNETARIVGGSVQAGAQAMQKSAAERQANADPSVQADLAKVEQTQEERAAQLRVQRQAKRAKRFAERVERDATKGPTTQDVQAAIDATRDAQVVAERQARVAARIVARAERSLQKATEMNTESRAKLKEILLQDKDVIMQQVWDEQFSDSMFDAMKGVSIPSLARFTAEAQAGALIGRAGKVADVAQKTVRAAHTTMETYRNGHSMMKTAASTARIYGAKDIADEGLAGARARYVRQLDETLSKLPTGESTTPAALAERLKTAADIHSTVVTGFDIDKATSFSARDAIIKVLGLEPGKEYWQQTTELGGDVLVGSSVRTAVQSYLGSWFS